MCPPPPPLEWLPFPPLVAAVLITPKGTESSGSGRIGVGKTGVTADRAKVEFRLFNSSSIFNIALREELFSLPKKNQTCRLVLVSW